MCLYCCMCIFFFFKQKTAYEMRISDWSSDVCSSDLALTDETRRRLQKKFSDRYKVITTPDVELAENNILIFPQERALNYIDKLQRIDILIIDEFYKASVTYDKDRAPILLKAILELGNVASQK